MLSFTTKKNAPTGIHIVADDAGIAQLVELLEVIKSSKDDIDLVEGNELDEFPIPDHLRDIVINIKYVKIEHADKSKFVL